MEIKIPTKREPCFDGLARLSENLIVVKCVEEGEIYVFDFAQVNIALSLPVGIGVLWVEKLNPHCNRS